MTKRYRTRAILVIAVLPLASLWLAPSAAQAKGGIGKIVVRKGVAVTIPASPLAIGSSFSQGDASADCKSGETLAGGGALGETRGTFGIYLQSSSSDILSPNRWLVQAVNSSSSDAYKLTAYALCAQPAGSGPSLGMVVLRAGTPVPIGSLQSKFAYASCKSGESLAGGGTISGELAAGAALLQVSAPDPSNARGWTARAYNSDASVHNLTAYAFCSRPSTTEHVVEIVTRAGDERDFAPQNGGVLYAHCNKGEKVIGGGLYASNPSDGIKLEALGPDPSDSEHLTWLARVGYSAVTPTGPKVLASASAFCAISEAVSQSTAPAPQTTVKAVQRTSAQPAADPALPKTGSAATPHAIAIALCLITGGILLKRIGVEGRQLRR